MPNLQPGDLVVLLSVPHALLANLPEDDQAAIKSVIGRPVKFAGISYGQAELEFSDSKGDEHTIWVDPDKIQPV